MLSWHGFPDVFLEKYVAKVETLFSHLSIGSYDIWWYICMEEETEYFYK